LGKYHKTRTVTGAELAYASPEAIRTITPRIATRLGVVPFRIEGRTLSVATLDPGDLLVEDEIAQLTGFLVASFITLEVRFVEALHRHYGAPITARYAVLLRRLEGRSERPNPVVRPKRSTAGEITVDAPTPVIEPGEQSLQRTARYEIDDDVLELSDDDLSLFPSLRVEQDGGEGRAASAGAEVDGEGAAGDVPAHTLPLPEAPPPAPGTPIDAARAAAGPAERERDLTVPPEATEIGPDALLRAAGHALQNVEMRDDIADAVLGFAAPLFRRRAMLVKRKEEILGWRGEGAGVDERAVRAVSIPADEPSVFTGLLQGVEFWLGPLPAMPHNSKLTGALGGEPPPDCFILPIRVRDRTVCFLYGDNGEDNVGGLPLAELRRLAAKAGLGFQVYLIKGKIRTI